MNIDFVKEEDRITQVDIQCNSIEYATIYSALIQYRDNKKNDIVCRTSASEMIRAFNREITIMEG